MQKNVKNQNKEYLTFLSIFLNPFFYNTLHSLLGVVHQPFIVTLHLQNSTIEIDQKTGND